MGYPIEIANRMPRPTPVPVPGPVARLLTSTLAAFRFLKWPRRRRTVLDFETSRFHQGVDRRRPAIPMEARTHLDTDTLSRQLVASGPAREAPGHR